MVLWSSTASCAAGLTNWLKIGLPYYSKPRLGKLRQTGTVAVWLKTLKPMMLLFTGNQWFNECKPPSPHPPKKHFLWRVKMMCCQRTPHVTTATVASSLGGRMYVDDDPNCRGQIHSYSSNLSATQTTLQSAANQILRMFGASILSRCPKWDPAAGDTRLASFLVTDSQAGMKN